MDAEAANPAGRTLRGLLRSLYHGGSTQAVRFRTAWVVVDLLIIGFFIAAPLIRETPYFLAADYAIAAVLAVDLAARALAHDGVRDFLRRPSTWVDLLVLVTLLFPETFFNLGFLRVLRLYTLVNSEVFWDTVLRRFDDTRVEDVTRAVGALVTFIFVVTGFVYAVFGGAANGPKDYVEALYFTMTTLTTTGYGDVTLPGDAGKLVSIVIMVSGVTLFLRLAQAVFQPGRSRSRCEGCGLDRHEADALHCRACGLALSPAPA
jgi:voltage-gated potassium channel